MHSGNLNELETYGLTAILTFPSHQSSWFLFIILYAYNNFLILAFHEKLQQRENNNNKVLPTLPFLTVTIHENIEIINAEILVPAKQYVKLSDKYLGRYQFLLSIMTQFNAVFQIAITIMDANILHFLRMIMENDQGQIIMEMRLFQNFLY